MADRLSTDGIGRVEEQGLLPAHYFKVCILYRFCALLALGKNPPDIENLLTVCR